MGTVRNPRAWLLIGALLSGTVAAQDDVVEPPERVARLSVVDGTVSLAPANADDWAEAVLNRPLTNGDRIWVDADGRAELEAGAATIHLDENTGFAFSALGDDTLHGQLSDGAMTVHVRSLGANETLRIDTPNAEVALLQAGEYTIETEADGERTTVKTRTGEAEVTGADQHGYIVRRNEQGIFTGTDNLSSVMTQPGKRSPFELWAYQREQRVVSPVAANYIAPGVVGYRDLDTYGTWSNEPEYGAVWQPTMHVVDDWAPYRYGRWVWVSPWGWTWVDDAPWGFAPFHYGRWTYLRQRWCWVPGPMHMRPVYAPALVGWAGYPGLPSYERIGWFPLGPRDVYMPGYRTTWRYFSSVNQANAGMIDDAYMSNAYYGRGGHPVYRNFDSPGAVTVVDRDAFVSAHRTGDRRVRVAHDDLRELRNDGRPPAIEPDRASVLGARPTRHVPPPHQNRQRDRRTPAQSGDGERTTEPADVLPPIGEVDSPAVAAEVPAENTWSTAPQTLAPQMPGETPQQEPPPEINAAPPRPIVIRPPEQSAAERASTPPRSHPATPASPVPIADQTPDGADAARVSKHELRRQRHDVQSAADGTTTDGITADAPPPRHSQRPAPAEPPHREVVQPAPIQAQPLEVPRSVAPPRASETAPQVNPAGSANNRAMSQQRHGEGRASAAQRAESPEGPTTPAP